MRKKIGIFGIYIDFFAMNVKVIILGIHKGKLKVALNEKRKKLHEFSFSINIENFESFL